MAIKKSEIYSSLWASCDELRGGMDASQYKDYVLFMLFIKYISDKYEDTEDFKPAVVIPPGASFADMVELKGKSDIGDRINTRVIQPLIDSNSRLARSDFPDFNDPNKLGEGKAMVDRLTNLVSIFENPELDFSKNRAEHDDILGDAYEYLMRHFASESGKSKGQFYTPPEVSRIIAKVIGISAKNTVACTTAYDPTCGSGSLLLKVATEADKQITLEGQEKDVTTAGLARMNMILHNFPTASILSGDTLAAPKFKNGGNLRTYDFVVANPPFSDKSWSTGLVPTADPYKRFEWGEPPAKQGDYAYLLHIIRSMKSTGKAACILPHGVLFRGNAEAVIRKRLVQSGYLKGIVGLPANLFYGTGIPTCILVLDKENAPARKGIFMIDASGGFIKDGNKNRLREQDIHKIVDVFARQVDLPRYSRMVPFDEISDSKNNYNLNLPRYIDNVKPEDIQDIDGHLRGGIPDRDLDLLDDYWNVMPGVRDELFESAGRPGYSKLKPPVSSVKSVIMNHSEFYGFKSTVAKAFEEWCDVNKAILKGFDKEGSPRELIESISEYLLTKFRNIPLLDAYEVYQCLMDYWVNVMQDDCFLISGNGWKAKPHRILEEVKSGTKKGAKKDKGWACDLIPKPYVVARYFAKEKADLDSLQYELGTVSASLAELTEEHGGQEGILKDVSTKRDALDAYNQALVAVWSEEDKAASRTYSTILDQAWKHAAQIRELESNRFLSVLKNSKGNLTLKAINDRMTATKDTDEKQVLSCYLLAEREHKAAMKKASGLLADILDLYQKRLKKKPLPENLVDLEATFRYLGLLDEENVLKGRIKEADATLDKLAYDKYTQLSVNEIKTLVVDDKWLSTIENAIQSELDHLSQSLTNRVRQVAERYDMPLLKLANKIIRISARVDEHLKRMGENGTETRI
ncbi:MAG: class I SAM-dependent DNA methyltransferase [Gammaproteobacteria bacterium]|nr:class I SAM-dependent DNA methyltransferase [Gammaproteobacteria bacterium]